MRSSVVYDKELFKMRSLQDEELCISAFSKARIFHLITGLQYRGTEEHTSTYQGQKDTYGK